MSKIQLLRAFVSERLTLAAEEILEVFERTILDYEDEFSQKWENRHQRKQLDVPLVHNAEPPQTSAPELPHTKQRRPKTSQGETPHGGSESTREYQAPFVDNPDSPFAQSENSLLSKRKEKSHVRMHSEDAASSHHCQLCGEYFKHGSDLETHTRIHRGEKPYACPQRDKGFTQKDNPVAHMRTHTAEKPHQCPECGTGFTEKAAFDYHMSLQCRGAAAEKTEEEEEEEERTNTSQLGEQSPGLAADSKDFTLSFPLNKSEFDQDSLQPLCLYQLPAASDADRDSQNTVTIGEIKTEPDVTDCGFSEPPGECQQIFAANQDTPAAPSACGGVRDRGEPRPLGLTKEPVSNAWEQIFPSDVGTLPKPYRCSHCMKGFSSTKTLQRHTKVHTEDKSYQCRICERFFCQKSDLVTHTRIHTGEKPYQCQFPQFDLQHEIGIDQMGEYLQLPAEMDVDSYFNSGLATFDIRQVIFEGSGGPGLLKSLDQDKHLSLSERRQMVRILVSHLMERFGENPTSNTKKELALALVSAFPCLRSSEVNGYEAWYNPGQYHRPATGFLEERLRNIRKRMRGPRREAKKRQHNRAEIQESSGWTVVVPESHLDEAEVVSMKEWLKTHRQPADQVEEYMKFTAPLRMAWIRSGGTKPIREIIAEYPRLYDTRGMISQDFGVMFPECTDQLFDLWGPLFTEKILLFAKKEPKACDLLPEDMENMTMETRREVALKVLPAILPPSPYRREGKMVRPTFSEMQRAFIDVQPVGTDMVQYLETETMKEPHVLLLGDKNTCSQAFTVFNQEIFEQETLLQAVDVCFKTFFVFDFNFPKPAAPAWEFLQHVVYNVPGGTPSTHCCLLKNFCFQ